MSHSLLFLLDYLLHISGQRTILSGMYKGMCYCTILLKITAIHFLCTLCIKYVFLQHPYILHIGLGTKPLQPAVVQLARRKTTNTRRSSTNVNEPLPGFWLYTLLGAKALMKIMAHVKVRSEIRWLNAKNS
jgi:hypothetical protein